MNVEGSIEQPLNANLSYPQKYKYRNEQGFFMTHDIRLPPRERVTPRGGLAVGPMDHLRSVSRRRRSITSRARKTVPLSASSNTLCSSSHSSIRMSDGWSTAGCEYRKMVMNSWA